MSGRAGWAGASAVAAAVIAGPSFAQTPDLLQGLPCTGGVIASEDVVGAVVARADVTIRGRVLTGFAANRLGDDLVAWRNGRDGERAAEESLRTQARRLSTDVANLLDPNQDGDPQFVVIRPGAPQDLDRRLLNRQAGDDVVFRCQAAGSDTGGETPGNGDDDGPAWRDALVVTSVDDSGKTAKFEDRPFATFSWLDDRESGEETAAVDLYLGFSEPVLFGVVSPSLAYQRRTGADPLNDLTFALEGEVGPLSWSGAYETDDEFDSTLYRAKFEYEPFVGPNPCASALGRDRNGDAYQGGRCDLFIVGDYVDVSHIGDKSELAGRREFARLGARLSASWWIRAGDSEAFWMLSGSYAGFETISGDDANAGLGRISLEYLPSRVSPYSFGVTYERGEDLTSFTPIDQVKITLGFRR